MVEGKVGTQRTMIKLLWLIKLLSEEKNAYLKYKTSQKMEELESYRGITNRNNMRITQIKEEYLETFTKNMEKVSTGSQTSISKMVRNRKHEVSDLYNNNEISKENGQSYFENFYNASGSLETTNYNTVKTDIHRSNTR